MQARLVFDHPGLQIQPVAAQESMTRLSFSSLEPKKVDSRAVLSGQTATYLSDLQTQRQRCDCPMLTSQHSFFAGGNRNLEESFVMLSDSALLLKQTPAHHSSSHLPLQPLDSRFAQMARVFEIASGATKVLLLIR